MDEQELVISIYKILKLNSVETDAELLSSDLTDVDDVIDFVTTWLEENEFTEHTIDWFVSKLSFEKTEHREIRDFAEYLVVRHFVQGGHSVVGLRVDFDYDPHEDEPEPEPEPEPDPGEDPEPDPEPPIDPEPEPESPEIDIPVEEEEMPDIEPYENEHLTILNQGIASVAGTDNWLYLGDSDEWFDNLYLQGDLSTDLYTVEWRDSSVIVIEYNNNSAETVAITLRNAIALNNENAFDQFINEHKNRLIQAIGLTELEGVDWVTLTSVDTWFDGFYLKKNTENNLYVIEWRGTLSGQSVTATVISYNNNNQDTLSSTLRDAIEQYKIYLLLRGAISQLNFSESWLSLEDADEWFVGFYLRYDISNNLYVVEQRIGVDGVIAYNDEDSESIGQALLSGIEQYKADLEAITEEQEEEPV